ncbi:hypothetical protein FZC79_11710 [Rossellomorea vietnamensis]|uniref:Beta-lactamase-related domain-containing protein n=2 Tax=Rossellomorea TaxID=2837508 RepID=A0A5D4KCM5_9BACI|nr:MULTISPECIES: hypothetical protein [Rossellomorea]TYR75078.1 hypothetical protein FZC79_11710 [Rossellomorea vietnamensis]TYS79834.1 hypothetical protein FZC80_09360 [Rossellomorea aquimaris]
MNTSETLTKQLAKDKILGCVVSKKNKVVFQYYKNRKIAGKHHKINSCTKSLLSALYGIAFDKG